MTDPFLNVDFEPLYYDLDAAMLFLQQLPDAPTVPAMDFHLYWKTVRPFGRKQILPIKSFLATQPETFRLNLWSTSDLTSDPLLHPWLKYINFKIYNPVEQGRDTILEGTRQLSLDDAMVFIGGDLFRALILHKHGGVYVDMDSVFLRPFSALLGTEFMYKWSFQKDMISSAVMHLHQRSELSLELLRGILELPAGGTNWGCQNNMRAFAIQPKMLLLDEPFGALDALTRGTIQDELMTIVRQTQQTVFMITHDVDEAILLSDRILLMSNGNESDGPYVPGGLAEVVVNPLPRQRTRAQLHHLPGYYDLRNHIVDFLVSRAKAH